MIEIKTSLEYTDAKKIFKKPLSISFIFMAIGAIGLVAYIVFGTIFEPTNLDWLLISALPFVVGLVIFLTLNKQIKKLKQKPTTLEYKFDQTGFSVFFDNESSSKIEYASIKKIKETKAYLCIYLQPNVSLIIRKCDVSHDDLDEIKRLISKN